MNYSEALDYIHSTQRFGSKPGLSRVKSLCERMGNPQDKLRYVHVAGTNGKGSTCAMTASILKAAGYRAGLYVSPYISDFRERIQVGGAMIEKDELAEHVASVKRLVDDMVSGGEEHPTEFEIITALAFQYFHDKKCDIVVLETGMGGRYDATNIIPAPDVAVITTISFDHMEFLGSTLSAIAAEKCGIVKPGCSLVTCYGQLEDPMQTVKRAALENGVQLYWPDETQLRFFDSGLDGSKVIYKDIELFIPLAGAHQIVNALTSVETILCLAGRGFDITDDDISRGIAATHWNGRMEIVRREPLSIVDAAHNADGVFVFSSALDSLFSGRRIIAIMGMLSDKDYQHCVPQIARRCSAFIAVPTLGKRGLAASRVARVASMYCKNVSSCQDMREAVEMALNSARVNDVVVACGSFTLIGEATSILRGS